MTWGEEWPRHRARLMAAAMQPVEKQAHDEQLWRQLTDYLSHLDTDEPLKCEFPDQHDCGQVTHRFTYCGDQVNVCERVAKNRLWCMSEGRRRCGDCKRPCGECWKVRPI